MVVGDSPADIALGGTALNMLRGWLFYTLSDNIDQPLQFWKQANWHVVVKGILAPWDGRGGGVLKTHDLQCHPSPPYSSLPLVPSCSLWPGKVSPRTELWGVS